MKPLHIPPNTPITLALVDPEGHFDFEVGIGQYQTTTGQLLTLPRPAVVILNALEPRPGEEITVTKHWSGKAGEKSEWTIALSSRSENTRAEAETEPSELSEQLQASIEQAKARKVDVGPPTPIRKPSRRQQVPEQPRLFDRGTGTDGPAPISVPYPALAPAARQRPQQIPANIATAEILQFLAADPNTANWSAECRQDLASTILIASFKAGYIGLWQRGNE